jgi:hypothetical protein
MTKDMHEYPVLVTLFIQTIKPDDQLHVRIGFRLDQNRLHLPEEPLGPTLATEQVRRMIADYIDTDPQWAQVNFVGFFDSIDHETTRNIRLVYKITIPENVTVSDTLEWKTYNELARTSIKIAGDHARIFAAAFNG